MQGPWIQVLGYAVAVGLVACADVTVTPGEERLQSRPEASLRAPVVAPLGRAVRLDASGSFDPDADPLTFTFEVNGVVVQRGPESICEHTFTQSGLYTVAARVADLFDNERLAVQDVTVITNYPDPPAFCGSGNDCVIGDECDAGVCYSTGGGVE